MELAILRNGSEVPKPAVITCLIALRNLMANNPIAFFELVEKARNPHHRLFGNSGEVLRSLALIERDGDLHNTTRDVVLSAISGEGLAMRLGDPFTDQGEV